MSTKAVYAGSFDPPTNGHEWMINKAALMFDELTVAIGLNPDKKSMFSLKDRIEMLNRIVSPEFMCLPNVKVTSFEGEYLVNYAKSIGAQYIVRGIRNASDYEYERGMRHINDDFTSSNFSITSVFLMPPRCISEVSSSLVKGLIGPTGWREAISKYVPQSVYEKFAERFGK